MTLLRRRPACRECKEKQARLAEVEARAERTEARLRQYIYAAIDQRDRLEAEKAELEARLAEAYSANRYWGGA